MTSECLICGKEIELNEQIYQLKLGTFEKDDFQGINFETVKSCAVHGYVHFTCQSNLTKAGHK